MTIRRARESLRAALAGALIFAATAVTACGGGGGPTPPSKVAVASIDVSPSPLSVTVGQTSPLNATTKSAAGATLTGRTVQWSSADQTVATVSTSGSVTGVKVGSTTVTATSEGVHTDVTVTVSAIPVASIDISPSPLTVTAGQNAQLTATAKSAAGDALAGRSIVWSTADQAIATVSISGLVSGVKVGSTIITATSEGVHKDVTVTVTPMAVATIDIAPAPLTVTSGQTAQLTATPRSSGGDALTDRTITWSSADATIAAVSATTGVVTGAKSGTTTVTATSEGVHKDVTVTVVAGAAASVVFVSQPRDTVAGAVIAPPVQVKVLDAQQNLVTAASTVTMAVSGGATLEGTLSVNAVNGVAAFSNLVIKQKGTGYSLTASVGSLHATSNTFKIDPGAPAKIVKRAGDGQTAVAGTTLPIAPSLRVTDAFDNAIAGATVTFAVSSGGSITGGGVLTDADGVITLGSWTVGVMGPNTVIATAGSASATFTANVGGGLTPGAQLVVGALRSAPTASVVAGQVIGVPITIDLENRGTTDIAAIQLTITWDPTKLVFKDSADGAWPGTLVNTEHAGTGSIRIVAYSITGKTSSLVLTNLNFTAAGGAAGTSATVAATVTVAGNEAGATIPVGTRPLAVSITP